MMPKPGEIPTGLVIKLVIPGTPIAKKRPRFFRRGKFIGTYNAQETEEGRFLWEVKRQYQGEIKGSPVKVFALFYMAIPRGTSKKKTELMVRGELKHTKKPDIDNLLKFTFDCLNGVIWKDDTQIVQIEAQKIYSKNPHTVLLVEDANSQEDWLKLL